MKKRSYELTHNSIGRMNRRNPPRNWRDPLGIGMSIEELDKWYWLLWQDPQQAMNVMSIMNIFGKKFKTPIMIPVRGASVVKKTFPNAIPFTVTVGNMTEYADDEGMQWDSYMESDKDVPMYSFRELKEFISDKAFGDFHEVLYSATKDTLTLQLIEWNGDFEEWRDFEERVEQDYEDDNLDLDLYDYQGWVSEDALNAGLAKEYGYSWDTKTDIPHRLYVVFEISCRPIDKVVGFSNHEFRGSLDSLIDTFINKDWGEDWKG